MYWKLVDTRFPFSLYLGCVSVGACAAASVLELELSRAMVELTKLQALGCVHLMNSSFFKILW